ncbi:MAG TPA: cytochrome c [Pyrinomonadaceae bacterium]|nr:cytochrome c [Pyrinomonadaceae bacterium]
MKLISLALTCVAIALFSIACTETATPTNTNTTTSRTAASPSPSPSVDPLATARANYEKNCEACHGDQGVGGLVKVENKQIKVASLKSDHAIKHTDDQLVKVITGGEEEMPAFKDKLSQQEIADLVRFVRKEFQGK